jgi:hypothetical protein
VALAAKRKAMSMSLSEIQRKNPIKDNQMQISKKKGLIVQLKKNLSKHINPPNYLVKLSKPIR